MVRNIAKEVARLESDLARLEAIPDRETMLRRIRLRISGKPQPLIIEKKDVGSKQDMRPVLVVRTLKITPIAGSENSPAGDNLIRMLRNTRKPSGRGYIRSLAILSRAFIERPSAQQVYELERHLLKEHGKFSRLKKRMPVSDSDQTDARWYSLFKLLGKMKGTQPIS
ncbi:MAG: hypothetical protein ABH863_04800 [Candidatus Micrarchaeota archaeon]